MQKNYYYKGQKIRTSEHNYTHAVIWKYADDKFKVIACSGSYERAMKRLIQECNHLSDETSMYCSTYGYYTREQAELIKEELDIVEIEAK